jgi:hypothetical protein
MLSGKLLVRMLTGTLVVLRVEIDRLPQFLHPRTSVNFRSRTVQLDNIKVFYLPTDAQENCFKKNTKIYIKTAPACFGAITIIRERIV